ncbi:MAG: HEAT repeat domain-containing protein [Candidatus Cloacimonas sp.]
MKRTAILIFMLHIILISVLKGETFSAGDSLTAKQDTLAEKDYHPLAEKDLCELEKMLAAIQLSPSDLNYEKDWDLSTWGKSQDFLRALQEPYYGLDLMQQIRKAANEANDDEKFAYLADVLYRKAIDEDSAFSIYLRYKEFYLQDFWHKVKQPKDICNFYETALNQIIPVLAKAYSNYDNEQWDKYVAYLFTALMENEDKDSYAAYFAKHHLPVLAEIEDAEIKELMGSLSELDLQQAGMQFLALADVISSEAGKLSYKNKKPIVKIGKYGTMLIGTLNDDYYNDKMLKKPLILLIEPGGNDKYTMTLATGAKNYTYLLIDYNGDDSYLNPAIGGQFLALSGLGISDDKAGNDIYRTGDFSFAAMMGLQIHRDFSGNDIYESGLFSQGAAVRGLSLLQDIEGNDFYSASCLAQGCGSIRSTGALLDFGGADNYTIGGKYFHSPLMPNDYLTLGQGMGFGFRPDFAGGLGLLFDKKGNDRYMGGVYAQGSAYWYALGMLIDESGNDVYNAIYYPQGSGIHLAGGFLFDGEGEDTYYSRHGPGQGAGHDWGVGIFIDAKGDDAYSIEGGNGLGLSNSVGIFVDKSGNDRYERNNPQNYGNAAYSRVTGSIGLFLDEGGTDIYPDTLKADGKVWKQGTYAIGSDLISPAISEKVKQAEMEMLPPPTSDEPMEQIFAAASEWEVGNAVERVKKAREIMLFRADEAIDYITKNKLGTKSGLEYRALEVLVDANADFKKELFNYVDAEDSLKAKNALTLIAETGDSTLIEPLRKHLENGKYVTTCLSLLGSIKNAESVNLLAQYAFHPCERYRYLAAKSLKQIGTPEAYNCLKQMANDSSFLVKALIRTSEKELR